MQNAEWVTLFRQFSPEMHPNLVVVLNNRMEVCIEVLFRTDPSYLLFRGRMGGTTEGGMLFTVPYSEICSVYFTRMVNEEEIDNLFGAPGANKPLNRSAINIDRPPAAPTESQSATVPAFGKPPEATSVARNNLLERLRAARQAASPSPVPK